MDVGWQVVAALIGAAFVAGWVDAVVGGGGLIQLPALLIGLPQATPVATVSGTNKISSAAGTLMATGTYLRHVRVEWRSAAPLMASAWIGSSVGADLVRFIPKEYFTPLVLGVLIGVGWYTVRRPQLGLVHELRHAGSGHYLRLAGLGLAIGVYDGLIGPGTGMFFIIALVGMLGYGFLEASAMAKLANLTTNVAALTVFGAGGHILWKLGLTMAAANLTGGLTGARMALRFGNGFVRRVFLVAVVGLGAKLAWDSLQLVL
ncbi:MAG: TSUP family transporter [Propionibacterium sp.]|nr:TSUP family transporter [Propionibacterium sp.]